LYQSLTKLTIENIPFQHYEQTDKYQQP